MNDQTQECTQAAARIAVPTNRDMTAVLQSVHTMFVVGKTFRYAELEARIRMQMAMRKMSAEQYNTAESYAYTISKNLTAARYAHIRDGFIEVLPKMQSYIDYLAHWRLYSSNRDDYIVSLWDYTNGFNA